MNAYTATPIALKNPPSIPGMACKLTIPHVSSRPNHYGSFGWKYLKLSVETTPQKTPTQRAAVGLVKNPHAELIPTPPAKVALQMSPIENFYLTNDVVIKVEIQLPVIARIVLVIMIPL